MVDSYLHKGLRRKMVSVIRQKGIKDKRVLAAMGLVPRHIFLDSALADMAYQDLAIPIASGQTISQPYTVAYQTQMLNIQAGDKVLEIGTGSGYQAAILATLGAHVFSIERHKILHESASRIFELNKFGKIESLWGDGYNGWPEKAPFDKIIVTAGTQKLPVKLVHQLNLEGLGIIPLGQSEQQIMTLFKKYKDGKIKYKKLINFRFVPFVKGKCGDD